MIEGRRLDEDMTTSVPYDEKLSEAFSIIDNTREMDETIAMLRDLLDVDHLVYHSSKVGVSPFAFDQPFEHGVEHLVGRRPDEPYVRLTYPAAWMKRYLQMGYIHIDPVVREGFLRTLPFEWSELKIQSAAESLFMVDAVAHGIGPHGLSIPVQNKHGHRGLFSLSFSRSGKEWGNFTKKMQPTLIQIANRIHRRVTSEVFGEDRPHLTTRELECLSWVARGKEATDIAIILNISSHTARDYLKSARYKLDCVTSAQAVSKAVKLGLLIL
jgi:DNA-binding CsgD family transcriptional regulator